MSRVEKTGLYRNADGHAFLLVEGAVVSDDVASAYSIDEDASVDLDAARDAAPDGEAQPVPEGEVMRDGVVSDGVGEVGVESEMIEQRDAQPVAPVDGVTEIKLDGAPENRMQPKPADNRRSRRQSHAAASDVELGEDESGE